MSINDGQRVRALESNAAWASKTANNTLLGVQTLSNVGSGGSIANAQQELNDINADVAVVQAALVIAQNNIAALQTLDTFVYVGQWNATTNTPTLADGDNAGGIGIGAVYRVSTAGSQNLGSGSISFNIGDKVVYNTLAVWEKWDVNDEVTSVNGQGGVVVLTTTHISEGSNEYFTSERAQDAVGTILTDTATVDFTYDDAGNTITADVKDGSLTNAKLADVSTQTLKGRTIAGPGVPTDLTATEATTILNVFTSALKGLVPLSGGGTTNFLRADGSWQPPAGGGGGGGGALFWIESTSAPFSDIENNTKAFFYQAALTQDLFCDFRVPSTYAAGVQIRLRLPFYSPDTSGTALLSTQSTLIRTGTDAITSTVNQRTSTNAAATLTVANRLTSIDLDLTSALGEINVVAVAPGDLIRIRLFRGTDTATSDIRALVYGAEVLTS